MSSFEKIIDRIGAKQGYGTCSYNVIPGTRAADCGSDFEKIVSYFAVKRQKNKYNRKSDVCPVDLKPYLPWISMFKVVYDKNNTFQDAIVTLQGSDACGAYGDCTGGLITEVHPPLIRDRVLTSMRAAIDAEASVIGCSEERNMTPPHVRVNIIYIPLSVNKTHVTHFFAYMRLDKLALLVDDVDKLSDLKI